MITQATITLIVAIFLLAAPMAFADYYSDDLLTINEFMQLDNDTLNNFSVQYLYTDNVLTDEVYHFEINLYLDYFDSQTLWLIPTTLELEFFCYQEYNCTTLYNEFIEDYKAWWFIYYNDLKADYG